LKASEVASSRAKELSLVKTRDELADKLAALEQQSLPPLAKGIPVLVGQGFIPADLPLATICMAF